MVGPREAVRISEMGMRHADGGGLLVHHLNEAVIAAADGLRHGDGGVISRDKHHPVEHFPQRDGHVRPDTQICPVLRHGPRRDHRVAVEKRLSFFQRDDAREDLRGARRIDLLFSCLIPADDACVSVDHRRRCRFHGGKRRGLRRLRRRRH